MRKLATTAQSLATETGLAYRPVADGQRMVGIYRRNVMLASGRYAMLDDAMGFSLVPWKSVTEPLLGKQMTAKVQDGRAWWEIGQQRGQSKT